MKKTTPGFSARATALAAPKKLEPTMRPRATSSAHSTGASNHERSRTEPITTARSAASISAAIASVRTSSTFVMERASAVGNVVSAVTRRLRASPQR